MSRRLAMVAVLVASSACDPCTGVVGCTVAPHIGASGRILNDANGAPAAGIPIDFVRTGGVALERDSIRTTTDREGQFEFDITALASGVASGYIRIRPASGAGFRVIDLEFPTSNRTGEARTFGPWSTVPHLPDLVEVYIRGAPPLIAASKTVEFRRTGGIAVEGLSNGTFSRVTDSKGWVPLFGNELRPLDAGDIVGDVTVLMPPPIGAVVRKDVRVTATAVFRPGLTVRRLGVGPSLEYHVAVNRRGRHLEPVPGTQVQFHRTGGVEVDPPDWTSATDGTGRVAFPVRPLASGFVTGDLTIAPPAPWQSFERKGLSFSTFEADTARLYDIVEVGPGVSAYAVFRAKGVPIKGVRVDFRRTGGIEVERPSFTVASSDTGFALLATASNTEGEVTADLTIRPPSPYQSFVIRGVRFQARDGDVPAVIIGQWDVASPPSSIQQRP